MAPAWRVCGAAVADPARAGSSHAEHGDRFEGLPCLPALTTDRRCGPIGRIGDGRLRIVADGGCPNALGFAADPRIPDDQRAKPRALIGAWPGTAAGEAITAIGSRPRCVPAPPADDAAGRSFDTRPEALARR